MNGATTELIVVRHGETVWNADGRLQGHLDGELSELGRRQAAAVADRLAAETIHALYSSDLGRAVETAAPIAERTGLELRTDARLRERCMGIFEGLTWDQVRQRYPDDYARYEQRDPDYQFPQGESSQQVRERVLAYTSEIAARHAGQRVVVVGHGGVLHRLFRHAVGLPLSGPRCCMLYNGSINRFFVTDGQWLLGTWGDIHHLRDIGTMDDI